MLGKLRSGCLSQDTPRTPRWPSKGDLCTPRLQAQEGPVESLSGGIARCGRSKRPPPPREAAPQQAAASDRGHACGRHDNCILPRTATIRSTGNEKEDWGDQLFLCPPRPGRVTQGPSAVLRLPWPARLGWPLEGTTSKAGKLCCRREQIWWAGISNVDADPSRTCRRPQNARAQTIVVRRPQFLKRDETERIAGARAPSRSRRPRRGTGSA